MKENTARAWVPDEIVPEQAQQSMNVTLGLKQSLRLLRQGKIQGYVDAMTLTGPTPLNDAMRRKWEQQHRADAERRYPEIG